MPETDAKLEAKRHMVARRRAAGRLHDAENCTSIEEELYSLIFWGHEPVAEWSEAKCDDYLANYGEDGQAIDDTDEEDDR